jgi:hypothetical protein
MGISPRQAQPDDHAANPNAPPGRTPEAAWRQACHDWVMDLMASPRAYVRRLEDAAAIQDSTVSGNRLGFLVRIRSKAREARHDEIRPLLDDYCAACLDRRLARGGTDRDAFMSAMEEVRQQVLALAPGVSATQVAVELCDPGNATMLRCLASAGWLPRHPSQRRATPPDDAARQAKAEALVDIMDDPPAVDRPDSQPY